jgi:ADP-heptose:LPS heptosyltransferase
VPAPVALVLRALNLGDLLVTVPALRALRRARPDHRVVLAAPGPLAPLATLSGAVDEVLPTAAPELLPTGIRPDLAVNLHGAGPQSHRALDATDPRHRIGMRHPGWAGPSAAALGATHPHERHRWCALLDHHGIPADPTDLHLPRPPGQAAAAVTIVHPGAGYGAKRWPADRFGTVAGALARDGIVVVTGNAAERCLALEVAEHAGLPAGRVLAGATSVAELAALVAAADLVVSGDTGVAHLASAFGTPSVVLFGPVGPQRWGPPAGPHIALTHPGLRRGDPFADEPDPALLAVEVDEVLTAARAVRRRRAA